MVQSTLSSQEMPVPAQVPAEQTSSEVHRSLSLQESVLGGLVQPVGPVGGSRVNRSSKVVSWPPPSQTSSVQGLPS